MERYKVIVSKLNVRKAPVADFNDKSNIITTVSDGLILDLIEVFDVPNPGLGKWYTDGKGQFYSGLGLQILKTSFDIFNSKKIDFNFNPTVNHWWIKDYGIDKIWEITKGAGVKIAVIDTGLDYNHSNIKTKENIQYYNLFKNSDKKEDCMDEGNHGTMCAGMIASQGPDIFGIAPDADLLIIRATKGGDLEFTDLISAIKKAIEFEVDIISISYSSPLNKEDSVYIDLFNTIKEASEKNILIIASAGDSKPTKPLTERYPASFSNCLSVGSVNKNKILSKYTLNENIDILAPGEKLRLLDKDDKTREDSGNSFSTPFVAGICALYLSISKNTDIEFLKNSIKTDSSDKDAIKEAVSKVTDIKLNLGIINPFKLFNL